MAWSAYSLWNAPAALSILGIGMTLPTIAFLLPAGILSDRVDRRLVMLWADFGRALVIGVLAGLSLSGALTFWQLLVVVAIYGVGTAYFTPAFEAAVPELVPAQDLPAANSLDQFVRPSALRLVGPAVGGALVAGVGSGMAFALDSLSFFASTIAVWMIKPPARSWGHDAEAPVAAMKAGLRFVARRSWLWGTL